MSEDQPPPAAVPPPPPAVPPPPAAAVPPPPPGVRRPWGGLDPTTLRPTLVVAALIAGLFFGSQVLNEAIPVNAGGGNGNGPVAPGTPVAIGDASRITPLRGWTVGRLEGGGLRLEKGFVVVDLFEADFEGPAAELARAYVDEILRPAATQLSATEPEVATGQGGSAARLTYSGLFTGAEGTIEGEVTVFASGDLAVVADAWAPLGQLAPLLSEVHDMLDLIEVQP
jgi:hypothetical protein